MSISCIVLICLVVLMKLNLNRGPCIQPPASDPNLQLLPPRPPASDPPDLGSSANRRRQISVYCYQGILGEVATNQSVKNYTNLNMASVGVVRLSLHGCFIPIEPVTKRLRPVIRNFFIATDLITTLATNMGLKMLPFYHEDCFELFF